MLHQAGPTRCIGGQVLSVFALTATIVFNGTDTTFVLDLTDGCLSLLGQMGNIGSAESAPLVESIQSVDDQTGAAADVSGAIAGSGPHLLTITYTTAPKARTSQRILARFSYGTESGDT